ARPGHRLAREGAVEVVLRGREGPRQGVHDPLAAALAGLEAEAGEAPPAGEGDGPRAVDREERHRRPVDHGPQARLALAQRLLDPLALADVLRAENHAHGSPVVVDQACGTPRHHALPAVSTTER